MLDKQDNGVYIESIGITNYALKEDHMEDEKRDITPEEQEQIDFLLACLSKMDNMQRTLFMAYADGAAMAASALRRTGGAA